jgi:hypothetical protein
VHKQQTYEEWARERIRRARESTRTHSAGEAVFERGFAHLEAKRKTNMGKIPIDPALTEHDSMEEALAYDKWFREEVQLSLDEEGDDIPHDQVVANLRARAEARRKARNAG